ADLNLTGYKLVFDDEFNGTSVDRAKWADTSTSMRDGGRGNLPNKMLEWNSFDNARVADGVLTIRAEREHVTSPSGTEYDWTSAMLTTSPAFKFKYGYIEERAMLPSAKGFWPSFWTWQASGSNTYQEVDVYEFFSDNHNALYLSNHLPGGGTTVIDPSFNPTTGYHTYGADISSTGVKFYIDGNLVGEKAGGPGDYMNLITNMSVFRDVKADPSTMSAEKKVDYIRVYSKDAGLAEVKPQAGY
ncbi:glycoside hydrolase family 16 protein, partial [Microvirga aerophila]|uniref:glycoside hydrolase family 16 protein n=1 Tax=Microvirga aerophila TaxID=670291 RepID=UPI0011BEC9EA